MIARDEARCAYEYAMMLMSSSLQVTITKPGISGLPRIGKGEGQLLTVFRLLPIGLKAYFDLDRHDRHNLKSQYMHSRSG